MQSHFISLSRTKLKNSRRAKQQQTTSDSTEPQQTTSANNGGNGIKSSEKLLRRHAGVLGLCACVTAFPYDVPDFIPEILMTLSTHVDDPQPIQVRPKKFHHVYCRFLNFREPFIFRSFSSVLQVAKLSCKKYCFYIKNK